MPANVPGRLAGVTDPEEKRKIIGDEFVRVFEAEAEQAGPFEFLAQGTLYPDVIESTTADTKPAAKIKTHHNVGGLPEDLQLRAGGAAEVLFKDEVRAVGRALGLPTRSSGASRSRARASRCACLGEVTDERPRRCSAAPTPSCAKRSRPPASAASVWQSFAVLLPVHSTGVMGDYRTYAHVCAVRAVTSQDAMTADWARLPYDVLARISNRIVNEVRGINRVVYDISSKPPGTIEWE